MRVVLAASLVVLAGTTACSRGESTGPLPSVSVERGTLERIVVATGTLEPERMVDVRPRIAGIVERIYVEDGDLVKKGQILVEIDRDLLEVRLQEVRADLATAKIEKRYAAIAQARADVLKQRGTMPDQQYDDTKARNERAVAQLARSEAMVSRLEVELRYATVRAPMDGIVLDVPVEEGSAVSSVLSVTGGTPLLTLASTTALHLEGQVDENEISRVAIGQSARIRTEAFGYSTTFVGVVRRISPVGKRVQNVTYFEVEVEVGAPSVAQGDDDAEDGTGSTSGLLPRMSADADIVTETAANVLFVPETALHYEGDDIYLIRGAEAKPSGSGVGAAGDRNSGDRIQVQLGIVDGDRVQLLSGASEGDLVLLR